MLISDSEHARALCPKRRSEMLYAAMSTPNYIDYMFATIMCNWLELDADYVAAVHNNEDTGVVFW
jgi:hypothetical protein